MLPRRYLLSLSLMCVPACVAVVSGCSGSSAAPSAPASSAKQAASTKISLSVSATSVTVGSQISMTATVTQGATAVTSGSVAFYDGTTSLSTQALGSAGTASWSTTQLAAGTHSVTAQYLGDAANASSTSAAVTLTVVQAVQTTTVTLTTPTASALQGIPVEFIATVAPAGASSSMPTGTVTFANGSTTLGTAMLDGTGTANFVSTLLPSGTAKVTATYAGDSGDSAASSAPAPVSIKAAPAPSYTNPLVLNVTNSLKAVSCADPAIYKLQAGGVDTWYLYCTSDALYAGDPKTHYINVFHSADLVNWTYDGDAFQGLPAWAGVSGAMLWAPAIKYFNGQYYLYYSTPVSGLAGGGSAIGVGTSASPAGPFVDSGKPVVEPELATNCCAGQYRSTLDPDVIEDGGGQRYILFGSFNGGLYVRKLSSDGLTSDASSETLVAADSRYEGGNWFRHDGYYYLFASSTNCCNGPLSGYGVFVARAATPMGPYLDAQGIAMSAVNSGGSPVLSMNGNTVIGPGGNVVFTDEAGQDYMLYHAILAGSPYYAGSVGYTARPAFIDALDWVNGWPVVRGGYGASDAVAAQPMPAAQPGQAGQYAASLRSPDGPRTQIKGLSDEFISPGLSAQWAPLHGTPNYSVTTSGLQIESVPADPVSTMSAVPMLSEPAPAGDFMVETKLDLNLPGSGPGTNYAQAGLIVYGDDDDFVRLDLFNANDTRQIEFVRAQTPPAAGYPHWGATSLGAPAVGSEVSAWLRIVKRNIDGGEVYTAYSSNDGSTWIQGGTWTAHLGGSPKICLYAGNQAGFVGTFHYLHVFTVQ